MKWFRKIKEKRNESLELAKEIHRQTAYLELAMVMSFDLSDGLRQEILNTVRNDFNIIVRPGDEPGQFIQTLEWK